MSPLYVVLLAGGVGSRLAPLSSVEHPKQFFVLPGQTQSLLQHTARTALQLVPASQIITLTDARFCAKTEAQLKAVDAGLVPGLLVEPCGAGTAAAATVAALYAKSRHREACLWLLPCDHDRRPPLDLPALAPQVWELARQHIVTFGVPPAEADTGFGYLLGAADNPRKVARFVEKPPAPLARALLETRRAWWNSGMFVLTAARVLSRMSAWQPETVAACRQALAKQENGVLGAGYARIRGLSIDKAVMERSDNLALVPLKGGWADIGTWPRLVQWWQTHAPQVEAWDFGNGEMTSLASAHRRPAA